MNVSLRWLRELATLPAAIDDDEIARRLTGAGLEVEGRTRVGNFSGVVVAEVRGKRPHPDASSLTLVDVLAGGEVTQVVCGARNVPEAGALVVWAQPGARLPDGRVLEPRAIRGVTSPGMLCASDELGLGEDHSGIIILDERHAPGSDFAAIVSDTICALNVTPNRPDCLGHRGVARELAALFVKEGARLAAPALEVLEQSDGHIGVDGIATVTVEDALGCPRYTARVLTGAKVGRAPFAARTRLESLGVRAISDVVDATNLAMLEWGQPLHAFDLDQLRGHAVVVRRALAGEKMTTLDGVERLLTVEDLLICDAERPIAIAGVMGGEGSGISDTTTRLLLESACFAPETVRRTAKRLGLHTEASHRFERGVDPNTGVAAASARCAQLLSAWTGARVARGVIDRYSNPRAPHVVRLRPARVTRVLGVTIPVEEQQQLLDSIELAPTLDAESGDLICRVPTFRPDLTREVDLVEELARLHGYERIPATLPALIAAPPAMRHDLADVVRDALAGLGLSEHIAYAFASPDRVRAPFLEGDARRKPLRLTNPLGEELSALRTSLLPGLALALSGNRARGVRDVRLFEVGSIFLDGGGALPEEPTHAAAILAGDRAGEGDAWLKPGPELDYFDVKGILDALLAHLGVIADFRAPTGNQAPWLHPGAGAAIFVAGELLGAGGEIHPDTRRALAIEGRAFAFEIDLGALARAQRARPPSRELPRHPGSSRDISFLVSEDVPASALREVIAASSPLIESVRVLEDYRAAGKVPEGKKGMLWSIAYRAADRTVTDEEVTREHDRVLATLRDRFAVSPR